MLSNQVQSKKGDTSQLFHDVVDCARQPGDLIAWNKREKRNEKRNKRQQTPRVKAEVELKWGETKRVVGGNSVCGRLYVASVAMLTSPNR